jgi:acyl-coenzyme A thioesterase PaaI-like protein
MHVSLRKNGSRLRARARPPGPHTSAHGPFVVAICGVVLDVVILAEMRLGIKVTTTRLLPFRRLSTAERNRSRAFRARCESEMSLLIRFDWDDRHALIRR